MSGKSLEAAVAIVARIAAGEVVLLVCASPEARERERERLLKVAALAHVEIKLANREPCDLLVTPPDSAYPKPEDRR